MKHSQPPRRSVNELIERSSLGSPQARAVRHTVSRETAAKLVARSAARGARLSRTAKKSHRS